MSFAHAEQLKAAWTDQYVSVLEEVVSLKRFHGRVGLVKTVNMNGNAIVQFVDHVDESWYDIAPENLKIVPKPEPKVAPAAAKAAAKPAPDPKAAPKPPAAKPESEIPAASPPASAVVDKTEAASSPHSTPASPAEVVAPPVQPALAVEPQQLPETQTPAP